MLSFFSVYDKLVKEVIKMTIFMTRHGQTDWNLQKRVQGKADIPLNETGIEQAKITSQKLKNEKIDLIICSPLKRAKKTAEIINEELHCPIIYEEGMAEREFGELEGKLTSEFDFDTFWNYQKDAKYERAENIREFFGRVYQTIDKIIAQYPGKNILIVSHGGVSVPVYCYFNGIPENDNLLDLCCLNNCEVVKYSI